MIRIPLLIAYALSLLCANAHADSAVETPQVTSQPVAGSVYMLQGKGGNIGLSVGPDGVFMIDDDYAPLTPLIDAEIAKLSDQPVKFLINTHWHGDHTGGNEAKGKAGAIIVAHDNVRERLSTDQFIATFNMKSEAYPPSALPVVTFSDSVTFHLNGDTIAVSHVAPAHTDGDSFVHFGEANVIHTGDLFFNGMYPFIDTSTGGNVAGVIAAMDLMLGVADDETKIIPGHGPLSNQRELQASRDMLALVSERIGTLIAAGKSRDEVIAAKPTADLDAVWGKGFLAADVWVGIMYDASKVSP